MSGGEARSGAGPDLTQCVCFNHCEEVGCFCREEEKIELRMPASDSVRLVSEISGDCSCHQMQRPAGNTKPAPGICPGQAGSLIAESGVECFDDLRNGDELLDVVLAKVERFHFVSMTNTPLQSSGGGNFFNCSHRSTYIWEAKSAGFIASASRKAPIASCHRPSL